MADLNFTRLEMVLEDYGRTLTERYKARLDAAGKNATGKLRDTIRPVVESEGGVYRLSLILQEYWKFLEYGTRQQGPYRRQGKFPPVSAILAWVLAKPVVPYAGKNGQIPSDESLAFLIARKIYREGTAPLRLLESAENETPYLEALERCKQAMAEDMQDWLNSLLNDL